MGALHAWLLHRRNPRRVSGVRLQRRFTERQSDARQSLNALLFEELLDALDRVAFVVQETLDEPQTLDVVRAIIAPAAGPLERPDLGKTGLPEAQDMLRQ